MGIYEEGAPYRSVAVAAGVWSADFSVPWGDQGTWDIGPGTQGEANESDADGDCHATVVGPFRIRRFAVDSESSQVWSIGEGWVEGATASLSIDDGSGGVPEYSDTVLVERWGPGPEQVGFSFDTQPFVMAPGYVVSVDDGVTFKTVEVAELTVTGADDASDTVSGTASAGATVSVDADGGCGFEVVADGGGVWSADFSGAPCFMDLGPGSRGAAQIIDAEGDTTHRRWQIANLPSFSVRIDEGQVHGYEWPLGTDVTLEVDDPGNGVGVDYTETRSPEPAPWDPGQTWVQFRVAEGGFTLAAGQLVSMFNGDTTKTHTVTDLAVTDVNRGGRYGVGDDEFGVRCGACGDYGEGAPYRSVTVAAGVWSADFSVPWEDQGTWDIEPGTQGEAERVRRRR